MINSVGAVFDNPFVFRDRFSGAEDFFKAKDDIEPDPVRGLAMRKTNFIPDVINCELPLDNRRSPGYRRVEPFMTNNQFYLLDRPARERPLFEGPRPHFRGDPDLPQRQGLYLFLARALRRAALAERPCRPDQPRSTTSRSAWSPRRPAARAGITSISASSKEDFRLTAWFGPQIPAATRRARREAHRLHRDRRQSGRHRHPLLDGGSLYSQGIRSDPARERRALPHGPEMVPEAGRRRHEEDNGFKSQAGARARRPHPR